VKLQKQQAQWPFVTGLLLLGVWLCAGSARAQPLMVTEHDWTFQAGNSRYGIFQSNIIPGGLNRRTTVYCGSALFTVSMRAEVLLALVVVPVATLGTVVLITRRRRPGDNDK
jgi:hypothetical protein